MIRIGFVTCAFIALMISGIVTASAEVDHLRRAEKLALAAAGQKDYPFAGIWQSEACCGDKFGFAIAPAGNKKYSLDLCGPGGCFDVGTYRPLTTIVSDKEYRVINKDAFVINGGGLKAVKAFRCKAFNK